MHQADKTKSLNSLFRKIDALDTEAAADVRAALGRYLEALGAAEEEHARRSAQHTSAVSVMGVRVGAATTVQECQLAVSIYLGELRGRAPSSVRGGPLRRMALVGGRT